MKVLNDIFTGKDNLTYDAARVVGVLGAFAYIVFWCVQVAIARQFGAGRCRRLRARTRGGPARDGGGMHDQTQHRTGAGRGLEQGTK